ncbi:MAG: MBL fold metallo-hydrolase [Alicyclobacillaceae bacterium]|uniref:MBL fold metallo-hydrolase n=1 Tax=Alicyclobacillus sp. SP_1 TaxID=2942475 RepID=UPI0021578789|nr:MBL fold metallo-hydrolase [Alicyclobacillus sp. SP_1]MCY0887583.1 MBL fold metallo-hydrolase [Alicyclobacillaceae bacterium]
MIWKALLLIVLVVMALALWVYWQYKRMTKSFPRPEFRPAKQRPSPREWGTSECHISWLGHSTLLCSLGNVLFMTDPVFSPKVGVRLGPLIIGPRRYSEPGLALSDIPTPDVVLMSHAHLDHFDIPSLRKVLHPEAIVVTPKGTGRLVRRVHSGKICELSVGESVRLENGMTVESVPVRHWGNRFPWNRSYGYCGYLVEKDGARIFFAGDTAHVTHFADLRQHGTIDVACIPIGAYAPETFQGAHCTPEQAWDMFLQTGAKFLVPIHWGTFVLSQEPIDEPLHRLEQAAGSERRRIVIRQIGEEFAFASERS